MSFLRSRGGSSDAGQPRNVDPSAIAEAEKERRKTLLLQRKNRQRQSLLYSGGVGDGAGGLGAGDAGDGGGFGGAVSV